MIMYSLYGEVAEITSQAAETYMKTIGATIEVLAYVGGGLGGHCAYVLPRNSSKLGEVEYVVSDDHGTDNAETDKVWATPELALFDACCRVVDSVKRWRASEGKEE